MTIPGQPHASPAEEAKKKEVRRQLDFAYACFAFVGFTMLAIVAEPFFVDMKSRGSGRLWLCCRHGLGSSLDARTCARHLLDRDAPTSPANRNFLHAQRAASISGSNLGERFHGVGLRNRFNARTRLVVHRRQMA